MSERVHDFMASIVVFLVTLPLCMGIAIASGAPVQAGLITGILGGIVVGLLGGAPLQVSGPAAGLTVICWDLIQKHNFETLGVIVVVAGLIQIAAAVLRLGNWFRAVSPAVIHGMLAGIGVLIVASQFHIMLDDTPKGSGLKNIIAIPDTIFKGIFPLDGSKHHLAALIGVITIVSMILWNRFKPAKLKALPAPLFGVVLGSFVTGVFALGINTVQVPNDFFGAIRPLSFDFILSQLSQLKILIAAAAMALIASAETLLCASAVDQMKPGHRTQYDRELAAQGLGNTLAGFLGGLPMTGVIVRSSANIASGGRTRLSTILHGLWILVFVATLPFVLSKVPTAALAAILVFTGYKLVNLAVIRDLRGFGKMQVAIYAATVITIVVTDLLTGVATGFGIALLKMIYDRTHFEAELIDINVNNGKKVIALHGAATFLQVPKLAKALDSLADGEEAELQVDHLDYIDHACMQFLKSQEKAGIKLHIPWEDLKVKVIPLRKRRAAARV